MTVASIPNATFLRVGYALVLILAAIGKGHQLRRKVTLNKTNSIHFKHFPCTLFLHVLSRNTTNNFSGHIPHLLIVIVVTVPVLGE